MKKIETAKKIFTAMMAAVMLAGSAAVVLPQVSSDSIGIVASAASNYSNGFYYEVLTNKTARIIGYTGNIQNGKLVIPSKLNNIPVKEITGNVFKNGLEGLSFIKNRSAVKEVVVSEGITTLMKEAFAGCNNLQKVTLPNSLRTIQDGVFYVSGTPKLKNIIVPGSVTKIDPGCGLGIKNYNEVMTDFVLFGKKGSAAEKYIMEINAMNYKRQASFRTYTDLSINKTVLTLGKGENFKLTANQAVSWRTSNSKIATIDKNGNVKAVGTGKVWLTVKSNAGQEKTCTLTVKKAPTWVKLNKGVLTLKVGQTGSLSASVASDAGCAKRTFRTSNSNIVKMTRTDWTGNFKAVKPGIAYVTVRTYNGKEASCKVTVVK